MARRWLALLALLTVGCGEEVGPVPADPPPFSCGTPQRTPITNVHEHLTAADLAPRLVDLSAQLEVERTVLLPFFRPRREQSGEELVQALAAPDHLTSFITVSALDVDAPQRIEAHVAAGGRGVKMFSGHSDFKTPFTLSGELPEPIYQTIERLGVPLLIHVNGTLYLQELRTVLSRHPKMVVACPHFCMLGDRPDQLHALLVDFPSLYSDVSFGSKHIQLAGMQTVSRHAAELRAVVRSHRARFLFGTDISLSPSMSDDEYLSRGRMYRQMLEQERYTAYGMSFSGMQLDDCTLEAIYRSNPERFLAGQPPTE